MDNKFLICKEQPALRLLRYMQVSPRFHTIDEKLSHFQDENLFLSQLKSSYKNIKAIFHSFNCVVIPFSDAGSKKQLTNVQISLGSESDCISCFGFGDIELNLKRVLKVASIYKKIVSFALEYLLPKFGGKRYSSNRELRDDIISMHREESNGPNTSCYTC